MGPRFVLGIEGNPLARDLAERIARKSTTPHLLLPITTRGRRLRGDEHVWKQGETPPALMMQYFRLRGGARTEEEEDISMGESSQPQYPHQSTWPHQHQEYEAPATHDSHMDTSQDTGTCGLTQDFEACTGLGGAPYQIPQMPQMPNNTAEGWSRWMDEVALANCEVMTAMSQAGTLPPQHPGTTNHGTTFATWDNFLATLRSLAYAPDSACPWRALGLDPATATTAMAELLEDRTRKLNLIMDEAEHFWGKQGRMVQDTATLRGKVAKWHSQCREELHEVHEAAKHRMARDLREPRSVVEPPHGLESTILGLLSSDDQTSGRRWISLLWLTNVSGNYMQEPSLGALPPSEAGKAYIALLRNTETAQVQANEAHEANLIIWLPRETCMAARLLAHMQSILTKGPHDRQIVLIAERPPTPAHCSPEALRDLWKTPVFQEKWSHLIRQVVHLREPEFVTVTTGGQIQRSLRSITLVRLGGPACGTWSSNVVSWKQTLSVQHDAHVLQVEFDHEEHLTVRQDLHLASLVHGFEWNGPFRSHGTTEQTRRLRYQVYAPRQSFSTLGAHLLCRDLKLRTALRTTNIGTEALINDLAAKIITMSHISKAQAIDTFATEAIILSPTEMLIDTAHSQKEWERHLSSLRREGQQPPVKEVRWRHDKGGKIWARPRGLQPGPAIRRPGRLVLGRVFLTIQGADGNVSHEQLSEVMRRVQDHMQSELVQVQTPGRCLKPGQWCIDEDPAGNATGHIEIITNSKEEAKHYQQELASVVVEIRHETIPIQVSGDALVTGAFRRT